MKYLFLLILSSIFIFHSCSSYNTNSFNEKIKGHKELYSIPHNIKNKKLKKNEKRILLVATNDFNGAINESIENYYYSTEKIKREIKVGGKDTIIKYFNILKKRYNDELVFVDSGNRIKDPNDTASLDFYNQVGYITNGLGHNEFNFNFSYKKHYTESLKNIFKKDSSPILVSNIFDLKTSKQISWKNSSKYVLKKINGINIGIISYLDPNLSLDIPAENINGLYFSSLPQTVIKLSNELKRKGAKLIILLAQTEFECSANEAKEKKLPIQKVNFNQDAYKYCDLKASFYKQLGQLPPQAIDLIIGGNAKEKVVNTIHGIPMVQTPPGGKYFSMVELIYNSKKDELKKQKTHLFQPIKFCKKFFKDSLDCFTGDEFEETDLQPASFLGEEI